MAQDAMPGSALPHLYVGLEYGSTGNHQQAKRNVKFVEINLPLNKLLLNSSFMLRFVESLKL